MLDIRIDGDTVFLAGRFDASQSDTARDALNSLDRSVDLDLAGLEYISSAGIGILLAAYKRLHDAENTLRLVNVPPRVLNLLRLTGLDKVMQIG